MTYTYICRKRNNKKSFHSTEFLKGAGRMAGQGCSFCRTRSDLGSSDRAQRGGFLESPLYSLFSGKTVSARLCHPPHELPQHLRLPAPHTDVLKLRQQPTSLRSSRHWQNNVGKGWIVKKFNS